MNESRGSSLSRSVRVLPRPGLAGNGFPARRVTHSVHLPRVSTRAFRENWRNENAPQLTEGRPFKDGAVVTEKPPLVMLRHPIRNLSLRNSPIGMATDFVRVKTSPFDGAVTRDFTGVRSRVSAIV